MTATVSLRRHMTTRLLWTVLPIVCIGIGVHWALEHSLIKRQFEESLVDKAMTLASFSDDPADGQDWQLAERLALQFSRLDEPLIFQAWTEEGESLHRSNSLAGADLPFVHGDVESPARFDHVLPSGQRFHCLGISFPPPTPGGLVDPTVHSVVVAIGGSSDVFKAKLLNGYTEIATTETVSILSICIAVMIALSTGVRLLERVTEQVKQISLKSLGTPLDERLVPLEIRPIVASLNRSMLTIREHVEREQRFNSDVAHELRTPIAELRAAADIAARWPDEESMTNLVRDAQAIARQMGGLVDGLLQLSALESGRSRSKNEEFDLKRHVALSVDQANRRDTDGREVVFESGEDLEPQRNPYVWDLALRNLLDNALSYSPPGSRIVVRLIRVQDGVGFHISNPTECLDEDGAARCTDRLWRADRGEMEDHFGLGLSIVQAACSQLGTHLTVDLDDGIFSAWIDPVGAPSGAGAWVRPRRASS